MIADVISKKKLKQKVIEIFIGIRKINISTVFITKSYFAVPRDVRLNCTHFFIMKIANKKELQKIQFNH